MSVCLYVEIIHEIWRMNYLTCWVNIPGIIIYSIITIISVDIEHYKIVCTGAFQNQEDLSIVQRFSYLFLT